MAGDALHTQRCHTVPHVPPKVAALRTVAVVSPAQGLILAPGCPLPQDTPGTATYFLSLGVPYCKAQVAFLHGPGPLHAQPAATPKACFSDHQSGAPNSGAAPPRAPSTQLENAVTACDDLGDRLHMELHVLLGILHRFLSRLCFLQLPENFLEQVLVHSQFLLLAVAEWVLSAASFFLKN